MKDKLKFRVAYWAQDGSFGHEYEHDRLMITVDGRILENYGKSFKEPSWEEVFDSYRPPILEIFTGISDKNGKEIYEGDIVRVNDHLWMSKFRDIDYDENTAEYMKILAEYDDFQDVAFSVSENHARELVYMINGTVIRSEGRFLIKETGLDVWTYWNESHRDFVNPDHKLEVIGNIHQNPELLEHMQN